MGKSSKDKRDAYYRLAKEQNWRARSAFKLLQIDEAFDLFAHAAPDTVTRVVDLCAAPGSWSQVLSRVLIRGECFGRRAWEEERQKRKWDEPEYEDSRDNCTMKPRKNVRIVAVDLQPIAPLDGITTLKADITHPSTIPLLLDALATDDKPHTSTPNSSSSCSACNSRPVDLVLSDGAPDVTGLHDLDIYLQSQLLHAALNLALQVLRPGGRFVAKIFRGRDVDLLFAQLRAVFTHVAVAKPRASRASSLEAFVVCDGFVPVAGVRFPLRTVSSSDDQEEQLEADEDVDDIDASGRWIPPFIACGDLSSWDADASYALPPDHVSLDPVQPPTAPPYKRALEMKRAAGGAYGKTGSK